MRPNFVPLTLDQFQLVVARYRFKRRITMVHVHHTWRPRKTDYRGISTIQGMWRYHTQEKGWQDIAQHVTIAPDGTIWTGRSWDLPPVSSVGHNGNSLAGPFMFEIIGDFDTGREKLEGAQRAAVAGVIAAVQVANRLPAEAFRFHRELGSPKTCPGTGVQHDKLLAEVVGARDTVVLAAAAPGGTRRRAARSDRAARSAPFSVDDQEATDLALEALHERSQLAPDAPDAEDTHEDDVYAARVVLGRELVERAPATRGQEELDPATLQALRGHVINLSGGMFSSSGIFQTAQEDVDRIFDEHLTGALADAKASQRPLRILFWAHGGLTDEKSGLSIAARQIAWWKRNNVYPIHFVWETGLLSTIGQVLRSTKGRMRAIDARDLWDHTTDPLVEMTARALGGDKIWSGMKFSAERASAAGGGAAYIATRLGKFLTEHAGAAIELHAVGHSAGSIFHAHFIPLAIKHKAAPFESLHFLAPAIRLDEFLQRIEGHIGSDIKRFALFTMAKDWEKRDNVKGIYRKSLLYLVSHAFEPNGKTPILGLEETIRSDARCRALFGLDGSAPRGEAVWSKTTVADGPNATTAIDHGGFDEDPPTMNSVARRVLSAGARDEIESFPPVPLGRAVDEDALPDEVAWVMALTGDATAAAPAAPAALSTSTAMPPGAPMVISAPANGRRFALCIGIDDYPRPDARLNGCVNDARAWAKALNRLGFEVRTLVNEQATRAGIVAEVTAMLAARQAGDTMVLQYSGHGTRLPDVDGDEDDAEDEAMCAYDFDDGHFVIDDDLRALFARVPKGVSLTCFFDCCHSGTITRVAQQRRRRVQGVRGAAPKKRSLRATPAMIEAHRSFRQALGTQPLVEAMGDMAEVVFTACRADQVAYESDGQGDFTRIALELFADGLPDESNDAFYQRILRGFGEDARQQPQLNSSPAARMRRLLAAL
jgi:hypothetical protein